MLVWRKIKTDHGCIFRMEAPGGWLVVVSSTDEFPINAAPAFVPDTKISYITAWLYGQEEPSETRLICSGAFMCNSPNCDHKTEHTYKDGEDGSEDYCDLEIIKCESDDGVWLSVCCQPVPEPKVMDTKRKLDLKK